MKKTGVWGLLYAGNATKDSVSNPFYWVYGESSCNSKDGITPPEALKYPVDDALTADENNGGNCWCKMTSFQVYDKNSTSTSNITPWVYLKSFSADEDEEYNPTQNCAHNCAAECRFAMMDNAFFRAQLFGDYSACKTETYNVTYELNGGEWIDRAPSDNEYTVVYHDVEIPITVKREGFTFDGWCEGENNPKSSTCSTNVIIETGSSGDKTYYARWKTQITFDAGTVEVQKNVPFPMNAEDVYYKETNIQLPQNTFERNGYEFTGWKCSVNGDDEQEYPDGGTIASYDFNGSMTCTAQWKAVTYNIHYNGHSEIEIAESWLGDQNKTFTVESETITVPENVESANNNYQFAGWCSKQNDDCAAEDLISSYTIPAESVGDVYLWAHWSANTYSITYYDNITNYEADPKVPIDSEQIETYGLPTEYAYGIETVLPQLMREHYNFLGWYDVENLDADAITAIAVDTEAPKSLVAKWEAYQYTITYYTDGDKTGTYDSLEPKTYTVEYRTPESEEEVKGGIEEETEKGVIVLPTPERQYFGFQGWFDCGETSKTKGQQITAITAADGGNWELCATWKRVACEDGSYLIESEERCEKCPSNYPYSNGATAKNDPEWCYAICWEKNLTELKCGSGYDKCDYYNFGSAKYMKELDDFFCDSTTFVSESHRGNFGENTCGEDYHIHMYLKNSLGSVYKPCEARATSCQPNYEIPSGFHICAPKKFTVTYHDGETDITNELSDTDRIYTYSVGLTLPSYQKTAYTFDGWYDNPELTGEPITEISSTDSGNKDFWAKLTPKKYNAFYYQGKHGTATTNPVTYQNDLNYQRPYTTKTFADTGITETTGYSFCGWSENENDTCNSDTIVEADQTMTDSWETDDDLILYAIYGANEYTLTYDCADGELTTSQNENVTVYYDGDYVLDNSICKSKTNYTISTWNCTNNLNPNISTWNIADDSTCTANWTEMEYNIIYKEQDGTNLDNLTPNSYKSSQTPVSNIPNTNPMKEHYTFSGWCDDENLTQNCAITREIELGSSDDKIFYAKWDAHECPAGKYLNNGQCLNCESPFTSTAWSATQATDCYYDCKQFCPENTTTCDFSGLDDGLIYYGSGTETNQCATLLNFSCNRGYTKNSLSCVLDVYNINYHNMDAAYWEDGELHLGSYTVQDSSVEIGTPSRDWYEFIGWCIDNDNCSTPQSAVEINPATTLRDIDLYAQWRFTGCPVGYKEQTTAAGKICVPKSYDIIYMDGGQILTDLVSTFTIEDETISLPSLSKNGYAFDGWCINDSSCTENQIVSGNIIGPWTSGNKTLYAQWTENEFICDTGKFLHIGNDKVCLSATQTTHPALGIGRGDKTYYLRMTEKPAGKKGLSINKESRKRLKALYNGVEYNIHDESVSRN